MSEIKEERISLINPATGENAGYIKQDSIDVLDKAAIHKAFAQDKRLYTLVWLGGK